VTALSLANQRKCDCGGNLWLHRVAAGKTSTSHSQKRFAINRDTNTVWRIDKAVIAARPLKAGVAWRLALPDTPKEVLIGLFYTQDDLLQYVRVNRGVLWARCFEIQQLHLLLIVGGALALLALPPRLALYERDVVARAAERQDSTVSNSCCGVEFSQYLEV
jgi:hypothetical protein